MEIDDKPVTVDVGETFIVKANAEDLCRLCANTDNQLIPIFRGEGLEHNLSVKIETHLPIIKVTEVDKLPLQICYQCASTLISWHNLYEGCRVADKRLREILSIDDKLYQEDETYADYVDDYRDDDYVDETHESLSTTTSNTSNLASDSLKENPTEVSTLSDTKLLNETELDRNNERWSDCDSGDNDDDDYDYEYYYNDDDDQLTKVAQRSTREKQLLKLQKQQQRRRRTANISGTSERPALSCTMIEDSNEAAFTIEVCDCVLSRSRCERCAKLARFKCYYCPMVFLKVDQRNHHLRVSHRRELLGNSFELFCKAGQIKGENGENWEDEISVVLDKSRECIRYECDSCADTFADKVALIGHLKSHKIRERAERKEDQTVDNLLETNSDDFEYVVATKPEKKFKSIRTPKVYVPRKTSSRSKPITAPATESISDKITYECAYCGTVFSSKMKIEEHMKSIHDSTVLKMQEGSTPRATKKEEAKLIRDLAKKSFKRSETVTAAVTTGNSVSESFSTAGYYICAVCGQIFLKRHSFTRHVNLHSASRYDCDKCKKSFTTKASLLSHQNLKHKDLPKNVFFLNGRKYLKCEQCSFTCRNERNKMEEHMRVHTGEKPFTCELCGKQFRTRALLRVHTKYVHEGVKEHACDICGRCFSNKRYLEEHRRIHTGEKPLICDLCGKTFRQNSSLTKHVENHLGIKKHGCHLCGKRFSNSHHLNIHVKRHMGEANFVCDQCGKGFVDQYQLKNHRVVHSEERPFVCVVCGTGFKLLKHLKQHGRTHRTI